jgi:ABC-type transport system substrate-binding protein
MSDAKLNHDAYANAKFDSLCKEADSIIDEKKRLDLYHQAEDIAIQDAARVPIYFQVDNILVNSRVKGFRTNLFGQMPNLTVSVQ